MFGLRTSKYVICFYVHMKENLETKTSQSACSTLHFCLLARTKYMQLGFHQTWT